MDWKAWSSCLKTSLVLDSGPMLFLQWVGVIPLLAIFSKIIKMVNSSSDGTLGKPMLIFEHRLNKSGRMTWTKSSPNSHTRLVPKNHFAAPRIWFDFASVKTPKNCQVRRRISAVFIDTHFVASDPAQAGNFTVGGRRSHPRKDQLKEFWISLQVEDKMNWWK